MAGILSTEPLSPRRGEIDVWRIDLGDEALDGLDGLLCESERARAARLIRERDRLLWTRSRGALRMLLGRYVERDPRQLEFELGPYGKPALAKEVDLRFNLSHSGELMLLAVSAGVEVGVDVESARERHTAEFLREWTLREARVKCLGTGLAHAPRDTEEPNAPWTAELDLGSGAFAAVAAYALS